MSRSKPVVARGPLQFVLQADPDVSVVERRVVRQAALVLDGVQVEHRALQALQGLRPGGLQDLAVWCPVGTVEFVQVWMRAVGVSEPAPLDYPEVLRGALARPVQRTTYGAAPPNVWVKPVRTKAWTPHVKTQDAARAASSALSGQAAHPDRAASPAYPAHPAHLPDEPVWASPVVPTAHWQAEWRVYVVEGRVVGHGRYDAHPGEVLAYDEAAVKAWVARYEATKSAPAGYALDVALWADGQTVLVEVTDGWAVGYYRGSCAAPDYARLLASRWAELSRPGR